MELLGLERTLKKELESRAFETVVIGRTYSSNIDGIGFACDVGNLSDWNRTIDDINKSHNSFDIIFFVVGYARAKSSEDLTDKDWTEHFNKNLTYVALGLQNFNSSIVVTIGSQWSYKIGNDELVPYTISKHALHVLTADFAARTPRTRANHYCVPTMLTPQNQEVQKSFYDIGKDFPFKELSDNQQIVKLLVAHCIDYKKTGKLLIIKNGSIEETEH